MHCICCSMGVPERFAGRVPKLGWNFLDMRKITTVMMAFTH